VDDLLTTTRTFFPDDAVALRLPPELGLQPSTVLTVRQEGAIVTRRPRTQTWAEFMDEFWKLPRPGGAGDAVNRAYGIVRPHGCGRRRCAAAWCASRVSSTPRRRTAVRVSEAKVYAEMVATIG
jgi:virulence-associated protein VagC